MDVQKKNYLKKGHKVLKVIEAGKITLFYSITINNLKNKK